MSTHKWDEIKEKMTPERRARLDAEVRRDTLTIGPWFPNGVVPSPRQIVYAFTMLPYHVRCEILTILGAPMEDQTFVEGIRYIRMAGKMVEFMQLIRDLSPQEDDK